MKTRKSKAGRKLIKKYDDKNPVVQLITQAMGKGDLIGLAVLIGYQYQNLWAVYEGKRKMPILPLYELCKMAGLSADATIQMYASQPTPTKPSRKSAKST